MPNSEFLLLFLLFVFSALFSGAEVAFVTLNRVRVEEMVKKKKSASSLVRKLKSHQQKLSLVLLIANTLVNMAVAVLTTSIVLRAWNNVNLALIAGLLTFVILIFSKIIPRGFAKQYAEILARLSAYPLLMLEILLYPLVWVLLKLIQNVSAISGNKPDLSITEEELLALIDIGKKEGTFAAQEKEFIENILEFSDKQVEAVMTPRADMELLSDEATVEEAMQYFQTNAHTRIPVFRRRADDIVGLLSLHNLVQFYMDPSARNKKLKDVILRDPLFVPSTRMISSLFLEFQSKRMHLAMVVDEHGSVIGLITLEDILEEIVGDIEDERDNEEKIIKRENERSMIVDGTISLEEVDEVFHLELHEEVEVHRSINYMILKELRRFPHVGEKIDFLGMRAYILKVGKRRIERVRLEKLELVDHATEES